MLSNRGATATTYWNRTSPTERRSATSRPAVAADRPGGTCAAPNSPSRPRSWRIRLSGNKLYAVALNTSD